MRAGDALPRYQRRDSESNEPIIRIVANLKILVLTPHPVFSYKIFAEYGAFMCCAL